MPTLVPLKPYHGPELLHLLNFHIEHTFGALFESPLPGAYIDRLMSLVRGYPAVAAEDDDGCLIGFGFLNAYHPAFTFKQTAEISLYVHPDHQRRGCATRILLELSKYGRIKGISNLIASLATLNVEGLAFCRARKFEERGRLFRVGSKFNKDFDLVVLQHVI